MGEEKTAMSRRMPPLHSQTGVDDNPLRGASDTARQVRSSHKAATKNRSSSCSTVLVDLDWPAEDETKRNEVASVYDFYDGILALPQATLTDTLHVLTTHRAPVGDGGRGVVMTCDRSITTSHTSVGRSSSDCCNRGRSGPPSARGNSVRDASVHEVSPTPISITTSPLIELTDLETELDDITVPVSLAQARRVSAYKQDVSKREETTSNACEMHECCCCRSCCRSCRLGSSTRWEELSVHSVPTPPSHPNGDSATSCVRGGDGLGGARQRYSKTVIQVPVNSSLMFSSQVDWFFRSSSLSTWAPSKSDATSMREGRSRELPLSFSSADGTVMAAQSPLQHRTCYLDCSESPSADATRDASRPVVKETTTVVVRVKEEGRMVNDYLILGHLGQGSFSKVKLVQHIPSGQLYAMKVVQLANIRNGDERRRVVRREVAVMKRITHPHLVQLHEVLGSLNADRLFLVMQYIDGGCVSRHLPGGGIRPIAENTLRQYAAQLLSALYYLHSNGIIHRDIKPDNILVDRVGNAYLGDFGVSDIFIDNGVCGVEGTPAYMSPELCRAERVVSGRLVDVWALGISLYEMMYGVHPFRANTCLGYTRRIIEDPVSFPDEDDATTASPPPRRQQPRLSLQACLSGRGRLSASPPPPAYRGPHSSAEVKEMIRGMLEKDATRRWGVTRALRCAWIASGGDHFSSSASILQMQLTPRWGGEDDEVVRLGKCDSLDANKAIKSAFC